MGRRAEGPRIKWRGTYAVARFRHEGTRHEFGLGRFELASGERDTRGAETAASIRYAEVVSGRWRPVRGQVAPGQPIDELWALFIVDSDASYDPETLDTFKTYGRRLAPFIGTSARLHEATIGDYIRARLREVLRKTVSKELWALRAFCVWLKEKGGITEIPTFPKIPRRATGTRSGKQRAKSVHVEAAGVEKLLAALPAWSHRTPKFPVRDLFVVAWETGLRPETLECLSVPEHYKPGAPALTLTDDIVKERWGRDVPLTARARAALDRHAGKPGPIFGRHNWRKQWLKAIAAADMPAGLSPYDLRHARAKDLLLRSSGDIVGVAYLLGHKRTTTTAIYLTPPAAAGERVLLAADGGDDSGEDSGECPGGGPPEQGDRRGSNPRQLEPQRTGGVGRPVFRGNSEAPGSREAAETRVDGPSPADTGEDSPESRTYAAALFSALDEAEWFAVLESIREERVAFRRQALAWFRRGAA